MSPEFSDLAKFTAVAVELDDAELARQGPAVRGQLITRLERLARIAEDQLNWVDDDNRRDPRWAEISIRIVDRLERLYRLQKPAVSDGGDEPAEVLSERLVASVGAQFDALELEARGKTAVVEDGGGE